MSLRDQLIQAAWILGTGVPKAGALLAFLYFVAGGHMVLPLNTILETLKWL